MLEQKFNRFDEVKDENLKAFNRTAMYYNLSEDKGKAVAADYFNMFTDKERTMMAIIASAVAQKGVDFVRKAITKDIEFPYDPAEDYS